MGYYKHTRKAAATHRRTFGKQHLISASSYTVADEWRAAYCISAMKYKYLVYYWKKRMKTGIRHNTVLKDIAL